MSITDIDIILRRLSDRFNKIFYDREFVGCIQEDFKVILKNRSRCCVVVFPLLGPNYFKAVQYQAEIFDLEVILLGSNRRSFIAVCDKKFLINKPKECEEQIMPSNEQECGVGSILKKKRPERQLYIPPAQRRLPANELSSHNEPTSSVKPKKQSSCKRRDSQKKITNLNESCKPPDNINKLNEDPAKEIVENKIHTIMKNRTFVWWKYALFEPSNRSGYLFFKSTLNFTQLLCNIDFDRSKFFDVKRKSTLYILNNDYVLWQPKFDIFVKKGENFSVKAIPPSNLYELNTKVDVCERMALTKDSFKTETFIEVLDRYDILCDFEVYWLSKSRRSPNTCLDICCKCYYYLITQDIYNGSNLIKEWISDMLTDDYQEKLQTECAPKNESLHEITHLPVKEKPVHLVEKAVQLENVQPENVQPEEPVHLVEKPAHLVEKPVQPKKPVHHEDNPVQPEVHLQKNNLYYLKSTMNVIENSKKDYLEEEKEIMRKTKENINRKSRPIIKYVDEGNDALKIDKDDVNNWEDLFNDEGQIQEDMLKQIVHKVGNDVTIIKAKENYSDYYTKPVNIEELEHMVELHDFPPTLETHDLIHAFSDIKSDAMYVKWVDDTHAILVLGSSSQAQKAINVQNPLIKVRPMTAASKLSLSAAYKHGLKPAMKRPPTNLQTARRLITTHLGTKSGISKETSAKERNDLKAAREMKKLVKKNEQDAWEGNLRSSMS